LSFRAWRLGWGPVLMFTGIGNCLLAVGGGDVGKALVRSRLAGSLSRCDGWPADCPSVLLEQPAVLHREQSEKDGAEGSQTTRIWFTVVVSALLFASLHAPNPGLVAGTLIAGGFWTWHFRRYHNLPAVMASHLVLGSSAMILLVRGRCCACVSAGRRWRHCLDRDPSESASGREGKVPAEPPPRPIQRPVTRSDLARAAPSTFGAPPALVTPNMDQRGYIAGLAVICIGPWPADNGHFAASDYQEKTLDRLTSVKPVVALPGELRAGVAEIDITAPLGHPLAGFHRKEFGYRKLTRAASPGPSRWNPATSK